MPLLLASLCFKWNPQLTRNHTGMSKFTKKQNINRRLSPERLGEKGEKRFGEICADANLIANKSGVDVMGWDYLVEFPYPDPNLTISFDKRVHPPECKFQVKTVWDDAKRVELKLSAAERLAKSDRPSFIIVFLVRHDLEIKSLKIFHMLDDNLGKILKRLRQATAKNTLKINKISLSFSLNDGVSLEPTGYALHQFVSEICKAGRDEYYSKKQAQLTTLGFGTLRHEFDLTLTAKNHLELAALLLGAHAVEAASIEMSEVRFGIKLPILTEHSNSLKLSPTHTGPCRIIAKNQSKTASADISGMYYAFGREHLDSQLFRVSTSLFELVRSGLEVGIDLHVSKFADQPLPLNELESNLRFFELTATGNSTLDIRLLTGSVAKCQLNNDADQNLIDFISEQLKIVRIASAVFEIAGGEAPKLSLTALRERVTSLDFLRALIFDRIDVRFEPIRFLPSTDFVCQPSSDVLWVSKIDFQDFSLAYFVLLQGTLTRFQEEIELHIASSEVRGVKIISKDNFESYRDFASKTTDVGLVLLEPQVVQGAISKL